MVSLNNYIMAKKIGIASPFKDYNYGTVLQAFALYESLRSLGLDAEYLDYQASASLPIWKRVMRYVLHPSLLKERLTTKKVENPIVSFLNSENFEQNKVRYEDFIQQIPRSVPYDVNSIKKADVIYDLFIVGSDQTWSPFLNDSNSLYFLNFTRNEKKVSYAPSLGTSNLPDTYKTILKEKLSSFKYLSCREKFGADLLSKLTGKKVEHVLDPTLLLQKKDWEKYEKKVEGIDADYVLVYQLGVRPLLKDYATKLAKKEDLEIVSILTNEYTGAWNTTFDGIGPAEFLWLIHHATYVVTDSFHGTMFSINFKKQFFSFAKVEGGRSSFDNIRLLDFLSDFDIEERLIKDVNEEPIKIDYSEVYKILNERRCVSLEYLKLINNDMIKEISMGGVKSS